MGKDGYLPLFETKVAKGRILFRCYAASVFVGIIFICVYRVVHFPPASAQMEPRLSLHLQDRLSQRYEKVLPGIDIFVCTADPRIEPPIMVINTVLSVMAYNYPSHKPSVYLSDDGGSDLTFYALLEASRFSKHWLPFCRKFSIEPRSPAAYFSTSPEPHNSNPLMAQEWFSIKKIYEDMRNRIETTTSLGRISEEIKKEHKGFLEWNSVSTRHDHQSILQMVIDGRDPKAVDSEGQPLPTLVYLSREKRPQYHHNFKAGAMNALIRVSSKISNGSIILNVDCDMYSNNSESVRDALCFFMDEEKGHEIAYVQFPQCYDNLTRNDLYDTCFRVINEVELAALDANGGPCYIGSGCFHRRETLCGMKYSKGCETEWKRENERKTREKASVLEESCKVLASCTYEENTQWGKEEMGLKYDCAVEDIITGFSIQCRGWKSMYFNPERQGFLGVAPTTLLQSLGQHKRWSEGQFQIFLSMYCPFIYGHKKIPLKLQFSYSPYFLWAPNCMATLYYVAVPSLSVVGASLCSQRYGACGSCPLPMSLSPSMHTAWGSFFGLMAQSKLVGFAENTFVVTAKVSDEDVSRRYEQEVMEFGCPSPMFTIISTLAMLNLFSLFPV
ncbi:Cellulose synthase-like protein E6 [Vitis vinifera]|uniref:Cellulose synthase-like protein E6 n=1 Tax=Vitis vinifera TaxID=29760 RepID=A0A438DDV4_VITVI|nr:Cellulose synthase-like protein E6 [Vitis vinifera]